MINVCSQYGYGIRLLLGGVRDQGHGIQNLLSAVNHVLERLVGGLGQSAALVHSVYRLLNQGGAALGRGREADSQILYPSPPEAYDIRLHRRGLPALQTTPRLPSQGILA